MCYGGGCGDYSPTCPACIPCGLHYACGPCTYSCPPRPRCEVPMPRAPNPCPPVTVPQWRFMPPYVPTLCPCPPEIMPPEVPVLPSCKARTRVPCPPPPKVFAPCVPAPPVIPVRCPQQPCTVSVPLRRKSPLRCYPPVLPCYNPCKGPPPTLPHERPKFLRSPPTPLPVYPMYRRCCPDASFDPITSRAPLIVHDSIVKQRPPCIARAFSNVRIVIYEDQNNKNVIEDQIYPQLAFDTSKSR